MNKIHINRLKKLANHLRNGQLGHKRFDFSIYNGLEYGVNEPFSKNGCGTIGCALGECPIIFKDWKFKPRFTSISISNEQKNVEIKAFFPAYKNKRHADTSAIEYFGLNKSECAHLFIPDEQIPKRFGGKVLSDYATRKQVAANIEAFIKLKTN